jgi:hypothetical protein
MLLLIQTFFLHQYAVAANPNSPPPLICYCCHSSSSSSIIFFFQDEELGWMDDGTDDETDGWKGQPDKTKDIIYEDIK